MHCRDDARSTPVSKSLLDELSKLFHISQKHLHPTTIVCEECGTLVAKISQSTIDRLKNENKNLHHIIDKVLLQASLLELANIDVS